MALLVIGLGVTVLAFFLARQSVRTSEDRILGEQASQTAAVISSFGRQIEAILYAGSVVADVSDGDPDEFRGELAPRLEGTAISSATLLDLRAGAPRDVARVGSNEPLLLDGLGEAGRTKLAEIASSGRLELVKIGEVGGDRVVGFGSGGRDGAFVVYAESVVPALDRLFLFRLPKGVEYALYVGGEPSTATLAASSTGQERISGDTVTQTLRLGNENAVVVVGTSGGLVGGLTGAAPWLALVLGTALTLGVVLVLEITRRRDAAEAGRRALAEQNERLRQLDALKDQLVAVVSHELRTPLTSILGYLELVRDDATELSDEHRGFLEIVDRNARRLLNLVGDLLFVARIDAGELELELDEVDLAALVAECVEAQAPRAETADVELELNAAGSPAVRGDRTRLAQLVDNLVSNAVKFTKQGGRVAIGVREENGRAVIEVADNGIGIPADEQGRLFDRFFRSSTATAEAIQGSGLGLTIAKAIVDAHGGDISVQSEEGVGTTFRVELPLVSAANAPPRQRSVLVR